MQPRNDRIFMFKKKKIIIWIVITVVILSGTFFYFKNREVEIERITEKVSVGDIVRTVSVTGEIIPEKQVDLAFKTGGKIKSIEVEMGDEVAEGQSIAVLENDVLRSQLWNTQIALDVQEKNLKLSRREWDDLKPEEKAIKKLSVDQARANVQTAAEQLENSILYAPINGLVSKVNAEEGEVAALGNPIISIFHRGEIKIEAEVPESDIAEVSLGQTASVTFDAFSSSEEFKAEVVEIEPAATVIQDIVYYKIKLKLKNADQRIKVGMSADMDIFTARKENVMLIPERAIEDENGAKTVQVLLEKGETEKVEVKNGLRGDSGDVEIISGLKEGDEVILSTNE